MRVVGSITSIPSRVPELLETLQSIKDQSLSLDAVYLCLPYNCEKEQADYLIPPEVNDYCGIIRCQDYGPMTKLMAILQEQDPETIIITFDDDMVYPDSVVDKLVRKCRDYPEAAIGSAGLKIGSFPSYFSAVENVPGYNWYTFSVGNSGESVDVLWTAPAAAFRRGFFPDADNLEQLLKYPIEYPILYKNFDVTISAYLSNKNIDRRVFRMSRVTPRVDSKKSTLNKILGNVKAVYRCRRLGLFKKHCKYKKSKTLTWPCIIVLLLIIVCSALLATRRAIQ